MVYLGVYLVVGAVVIVVLNALKNGAIFKNFGGSVYDGHDVLMAHGLPTPITSMRVVMAIVVWVFWPALIYGAVETRLKKNVEGEKHQK